MLLNHSQERAVSKLQKFLNDDSGNFMLLGPAGSGKTTVIFSALRNYRGNIAFCAFTNRATQVLRNTAVRHNFVDAGTSHSIDFMTIHILLGLEINFLATTDVNVNFEFKFKKMSQKLAKYHLVIFDECSTIDANLYKYLTASREYNCTERRDILQTASAINAPCCMAESSNAPCIAIDDHATTNTSDNVVYASTSIAHSMIYAANTKTKFIFIGDFWQLPPINESISQVFVAQSIEKWPVTKLVKVMRCANDKMSGINAHLIACINKFKEQQFSVSRNYPRNLLPTADYVDDYTSHYVASTTCNRVILTYSSNNCNKINNTIQDIVDGNCGRPIIEDRTSIKFYVGDRCCFEKPCNIYELTDANAASSGVVLGQIAADGNDPKRLNDGAASSNTAIQPPQPPQVIVPRILVDTGNFIERIYNGEIFDVVETADVTCQTHINGLYGIPLLFDAQRLTIQNIATGTRYEVVHINPAQMLSAKRILRTNQRKFVYISTVTLLDNTYPSLCYGYCLTLYKAQGSEWDQTYVNLMSIYASIADGYQNKNLTREQSEQILKATYTATTRARNEMLCIWL